uniref:Uncharacterized protein n=1 Tax=Anguilla anguilla TaxID=7936 RepID=A0A0E9TQG3_ANGAN
MFFMKLLNTWIVDNCLFQHENQKNRIKILLLPNIPTI